MRIIFSFLFSIFITVIFVGWVLGAESPQWGERHTRNMVSSETGLPDSFNPGRRSPANRLVDPATTENVRWTTRIGQVAYGTPVVAEGRVLIGTADSIQVDREELSGDRGVLLCLDEKTGEMQWELVVPKMHEIKYSDWYRVGITSAPVIEDGKVYLVSNRCEVMCLDLNGMADGNNGPYMDEAEHCVEPGMPPIKPTDKDADIIWLNDLVKTVGAMPHNASNCSILVDGDLLYVCTGNGVDWTHRYVMNPDAPTLVVIDKKTGEVVAKDDFRLGPDIIHGQWSSPSLGVVEGKKLVFQGTGSGHVFAVEALSPEAAKVALDSKKPALLKTVWKFNGHPLAQTQDVVPLEHFHDTKSYEVIGNPVFHNNRVYVIFTQEVFHNIPDGRLVCLDASKTGDTTRNGGLVWSYEGIKSSSSTVAIADGIVYVSDGAGVLHAVDAETGKPFWTHQIGKPCWASPLVADGKVFIGTERRSFWVFEHGKEKKVLFQTIMPERVLSSASAANKTLYIPVFGTLYAVGMGE